MGITTDPRRRRALESRVRDPHPVFAQKPWDVVGAPARKALKPATDDLGLPTEKTDAANLPRRVGGTSPAPTPKTGVAIEGPKRQTTEDWALEHVESWIEIVEKSLKERLSRTDEDARFLEIMRKTLEADAKSTAKEALLALPLANTLAIATELSAAFADGAGAALARTNAELIKRYDIHWDNDVTPEVEAKLHETRRFQGIGAQQLRPIFTEAFAAAAVKAAELTIDRVTGAVAKMFTKLINDAATQSAKRLIASNEVTAAVNEALASATASIPEARRRLEKKLFVSSLNLWLSQISNKRLAENLKSIAPFESKEQVDVALVAGLLKFITTSAYADAGRRIGLTRETLEQAGNELRWLVLDQTRVIVMRLGDRVQPSTAGTVATDGNTVSVPTDLYQRVTQPPETAAQAEARFAEREAAFYAYLDATAAKLGAERAILQERIDEAAHSGLAPRTRHAWNHAIDRYNRDRRAAIATAESLAHTIADEFPTVHRGAAEGWLVVGIQGRLPIDAERAFREPNWNQLVETY